MNIIKYHGYTLLAGNSCSLSCTKTLLHTLSINFISHDIILYDSKNQKQKHCLFHCACATELVVNNGNRGEIMENLRGELWEGRAVDGKLKSSLEWPKADVIFQLWLT